MSVLFQLTKFKLIELCLDLLFNKIMNNFKEIENSIPIEFVKKGMCLKFIKNRHTGEYYANCIIVEASPPDPGDRHDTYCIEFRFEETNIVFTDMDGKPLSPEQLPHNYDAVFPEKDEWLFIK